MSRYSASNENSQSVSPPRESPAGPDGDVAESAADATEALARAAAERSGQGGAGQGNLRAGREASRSSATGVGGILLLLVGGLLLIPAVWATLLLGGANVWGAARQDANRMATAMLVCWPLAIALVGAGIYYSRRRGRGS